MVSLSLPSPVCSDGENKSGYSTVFFPSTTENFIPEKMLRLILCPKRASVRFNNVLKRCCSTNVLPAPLRTSSPFPFKNDSTAGTLSPRSVAMRFFTFSIYSVASSGAPKCESSCCMPKKFIIPRTTFPKWDVFFGGARFARR